MANPTTLVESFNGSLGAFTGVQPIRYDSGLWLESGTTNYVSDPVGGGTGWTPGTNITRTPVTSLPGPLPGFLSGITTGIELAATGSATGVLAVSALQSGLPVADTYAPQSYLWIPASFGATSLEVRLGSFTGSAAVSHGLANMSLRDQWQKVTGKWTVDAGDLTGTWRIDAGGNVASGQKLWIACAAIQREPAATSPAIGSIGSGYSWSSTAHNSNSIRAASSASISPAGILAPGSGSLAFRFRRLIDTGGIETLLECGTNGASTDYLTLTIDASDKLVMAWTANGGSAQTVTSTDSIAVDTEYLLYVEWDGTQMALSLDNGALVTGTRDTPQGSWGAGDLVLKAE